MAINTDLVTDAGSSPLPNNFLQSRLSRAFKPPVSQSTADQNDPLDLFDLSKNKRSIPHNESISKRARVEEHAPDGAIKANNSGAVFVQDDQLDDEHLYYDNFDDRHIYDDLDKLKEDINEHSLIDGFAAAADHQHALRHKDEIKITDTPASPSHTAGCTSDKDDSPAMPPRYFNQDRSQAFSESGDDGSVKHASQGVDAEDESKSAGDGKKQLVLLEEIAEPDVDDKWTNCTDEEWLQGGQDIMQRFTQLQADMLKLHQDKHAAGKAFRDDLQAFIDLQTKDEVQLDEYIKTVIGRGQSLFK